MVVQPNQDVCLSDEALASIISCQVAPALFETYMGHLGLCEKCVNRALEMEERGKFKWVELVKRAAARLIEEESRQKTFSSFHEN
jgi:hypothetical protein